MVGLALLGVCHAHTQDFLAAALETNLAQLTVVWDDDEARGRAFAEKFGAPYERELDRVLALRDVEAVMVECAPAKHREVILKAANAKRHIFSDKALALTVEDCLEIKRAITANGVKFVISLEAKTNPAYLFAKQLADGGKLGRLTSAYFRRDRQAAPENGIPPASRYDAAQAGGVMFDLGCHGFYLLNQFCGEPKKVTCLMNGLYSGFADGNSTAVLEFENGAVGTAHTSLASCRPGDFLELVGTEGTLEIAGSSEPDFTVLLQTQNISGYEALSPVRHGSLPSAPELPSAQFVRLVASGGAESLPEFDIGRAVMLTRMIAGAYRSARERMTITF